MSTKIDDCLRGLQVPRENFALLLSDAASYMRACSATLSIYPNLFHVTCLTHMMHNCAERVQSYFTDVGNLIAIFNAVNAVKNKTRRALFTEIGSLLNP